MDIFKLCFHHDLEVNELDADFNKEEGDTPKTAEEQLLASFATPQPTYSRLWFSGADIEIANAPKLGLSALKQADRVLEGLFKVLDGFQIINNPEKPWESVRQFVEKAEDNACLLLSKMPKAYPPLPPYGIDFKRTNFKALLADCMRTGYDVLTKAPHQHGYDLILHSADNHYVSFFNEAKELSTEFEGKEALRIFSVNLKKMDTDKKLFFELYNIRRVPHGAEEILPQSTL